jgi:hypothetical protein
MTPLPCRADSVRYHRETHSYLLAPFDRDQRFGGTGRDARRILAEKTRHLVRKNDRCSVQRVKRIESYGQALAQSLHLVQRSKNNVSATAPGGRNQSVRTGGGAGCSGTTACFLANSCAALATETTESLRKSRRPYDESVATVIPRYMTPSARSL